MLRTFLALTLDAVGRDQVLQVQRHLHESLRHSASVFRPTRREQFHITLAFLGDTPEDSLAPITAIVERIARRHPPLSLRANALLFLPKPDQVQVVALGLADVASGGVEALASDLALGLAELGFRLERRRFLAHVTLFRCKKPIQGQSLQPRGFERTADDTVLRLFQIGHYASHLEASGARYEVLSTTPLEATPP